MRTIASMARAMLIDADLSDYFWPFAILCAAHIKCRVPHSALAEHETPFFHPFNRLPNLSYLHIFGHLDRTRIYIYIFLGLTWA